MNAKLIYLAHLGRVRDVLKVDNIKEDKLYSITEAADATGIDARKIRKDVQDERLPAQKIGWVWAILGKDLQKYVKGTQ
jgi:excisionase family DNA binding protein